MGRSNALTRVLRVLLLGALLAVVACSDEPASSSGDLGAAETVLDPRPAPNELVVVAPTPTPEGPRPLIVATLLRSIPSMGHVLILMSIIFYVYGVAGYHLFHEADPTHWRTLGISLLSLFRIVTLEDWTDIMYAAMAVHSWAWIYFVSFVVMGTFVVINLFIAVVLNNLDEAKAERLREMSQPPTRDEMVEELRTTQQALQKLQSQLEQYNPTGKN